MDTINDHIDTRIAWNRERDVPCYLITVTAPNGEDEFIAEATTMAGALLRLSEGVASVCREWDISNGEDGNDGSV